MDLAADKAKIPSCDYVVCCIPPRGQYQDYLKIIKNIACSCADMKSQPYVIYVSSTGVFDNMQGMINDKTMPTPNSDRSKALFKAENIFKKYYPKVMIVRPTRIYGPGRLGMYQSVKNSAIPSYKPQQLSHHIAIDDLVDIIFMLIDEKKMAATLIASDPNPQRTGDIYLWLSQAQKTVKPLIKIHSDTGVKYIQPSDLIESNFSFQYPNVFEGYINFMQKDEH